MKYPWFKQIHSSKDFSNSLNTVVNNKKMTMGPQTTKVENYLKKFLKVKHVVLTTSGTSALMMATMAAEIKHNDIVNKLKFKCFLICAKKMSYNLNIRIH